MSNPAIPPIRRHLETWEREAATQWQAIIRSPQVLRRVGSQIDRTLQLQQRIAAAIERTLPPGTTTYRDITRMVYLLERIEAQLDALSARIERLEDTTPR